MSLNDITVGIGGAAGDGQDRAGVTLARTCSRLGLHSYAYNSYQSVIRGGHIWLRIRIGQDKVHSHGDELHSMIALNQDAVNRHASEVRAGGTVIFNSDKIQLPETIKLAKDVHVVALPVEALAKEYKFDAVYKTLPIMQNTVALGALIQTASLDFKILESIIAETFKHKSAEVIRINQAAALAGYDYASKHSKNLGCQWKFGNKKLAFLTGNQAIGMGAVAGGCNFYSAYPMTPASGILTWMADHAESCGVVVKQAEDELAVICMAIGAGHAGARAMCATSGGGFALMTEAVGMASMIEAPVVVVTVQRGGPSTGLPTKTEQADLNQVFGASQGDFPRIIMAPLNITDAFNASVEALNLADKYQMPVMMISDLLLSEHYETVDPDELNFQAKIDRGELITQWKKDEPYQRYQFTDSGVSPRSLPGTAGTVYVAGTDEHDEMGRLISDVHTHAPTRKKMMEKRMRKLEGALKDLEPPSLLGPQDADVTLVGWGSTEGVIEEGVALLKKQGVKANHVQFKYLLPFHSEEALKILKKAKKTIAVENNYTAQFARHLSAETGFRVDAFVLKYDGEPFEPHHIAEGVKKVLKGETVRYAAASAQ